MQGAVWSVLSCLPFFRPRKENHAEVAELEEAEDQVEASRTTLGPAASSIEGRSRNEIWKYELRQLGMKEISER